MDYKFYHTLTFQESIDHPSIGYDRDNPYSYRCWYEEDIQDQDDLLVMVGDSWTWGDHLGCIDWNRNFNDPIRVQQIASRKLAKMLGADLVVLARPGCSNFWMLEKLQDIEPFLKESQNKYKKITVIVNLTEDLREAQFSRRIKVDDLYDKFWAESNSITEFLQRVEQNLFDQLTAFFLTVPFVCAHIARVFTDVWPSTTNDFLFDKTWCDVLQEHVNFDRYKKPVPFIGQMAIDPLTKKYMDNIVDEDKKYRYKTEFLDIMENVGYRWNFLGASDYNLKGSTYHPNDQGHSKWAEYLYHQLDK